MNKLEPQDQQFIEKLAEQARSKTHTLTNAQKQELFAALAERQESTFRWLSWPHLLLPASGLAAIMLITILSFRPSAVDPLPIPPPAPSTVQQPVIASDLIDDRLSSVRSRMARWESLSTSQNADSPFKSNSDLRNRINKLKQQLNS